MTNSNARIATSVDEYALNDSSVYGYVNWGTNDRDTASASDKTDLCVITVYRTTKDDEQTLSDGTVKRIEAEVTLEAAIWDNMGVMHKFSVDLQDAVST